MAYDEVLAGRIRDELGPRPEVAEIKMFGGLCFTLRGNMVVGVVGDELMVRLEPGAHDEAVAKPGARPMDFTGRPMQGFLFVEAGSIMTAKALRAWIDRALAYVEPMPPKVAKPRKKKAR